MASKKLGPYEILSVLGRGGMGTVFKARHETTGEIVAVKALSNSASDETHFRQRFESEIQALLKLNHPNIVRILSFGQEKGTLFFAMELVEGKSLFHLQREVKKFDWREVLRIARDVASALRHAHDRGIIHRDMKPGNLIRSNSGWLKVADFGIAKSFGASNDTRDNVIGTLDFMSPEQAAGKPVTVRSDLYSLGAVLYTLLSGQPPFAGNSIEESLRNLTRVPAQPIRERVPNVPEELEMLIAELLEKKPESRTPTAFALLRKLDYVEQVLRVNSEAKTAHGLEDKPVESKDNFLLGEPENNLAKTNESAKQKSIRPIAESAKTRATKETVILKPEDEKLPVVDDLQLAEPEEKPDYFKTVTEKTREAYTAVGTPVEHKTGIGWLPVFLLLVALVGGGGYGTYLVTRPPTAQQLFEKIEAGATVPTMVLTEIDQFLKLYPDDERIPQVRELEKVAKVMAFHNTLVVRARLPGESRLSTFEQKFVSVMDVVRENAAIGYPQLEAFVTLYDAGEKTPAESVEVVSAAKTMLQKVREDAKKEVNWSRKQITEALDRAATEPEKAAEIYRSIIKMYENQEFANDLVTTARHELAKLE
ncbi:MAG: serine/threonine-protein kinase [Pirellulaceae bacterium]